MLDEVFKVTKNMQEITPAWALNILINRPEFQDLIIELNTEGRPTSQLFELHIDSEGTKLYEIGGEYAPSTVATKRSQNPQDVNLKATGEAYESWTVRVDGENIVIEADLIKNGENLEDRYGDNIVGLFETNLQILIDAIADDLPELFEEKLLS